MVLLFQTIPCSQKVSKRNNPTSVGEIEGQPHMHVDTQEKIGED